MNDKLVNKMKLLVVEDETDACESIRSHFQRRGFTVSMAGSGEEALSLIKEQSPDVILLDVNLPKMSGIDLLKIVRDFNQTTKVILVSAYETDFVNDPEIKNLNIFEVVRKPVTFDVLDVSVKKAIG